MTEPLLSVRNVGIAFGGVRALKDVTFDVAQGSILSVIGPNGAGKTTLFNCVTGVYRPDAGSIALSGQPLTRYKPHQIAALGLARTFQNIELFARMTVLENVMLGRHRHMSTGALGAAFFGKRVLADEVAQRRRVEAILEFLDLQPTRDRLVQHLAYGVRKKVELARALALEPRLLLLDEPSAGMNAEEKHELVHNIHDIREEWGVTVVLVEHDMGLVMGISDRVVVLDHGEKIGEGTPSQVTSNPAVIAAYLGTEDTTTLSALGDGVKGAARPDSRPADARTTDAAGLADSEAPDGSGA